MQCWIFICHWFSYDSAVALFQGSNIQITCHSQHHLSKKVKLWSEEILALYIVLPRCALILHTVYLSIMSYKKWNYNVMHTIESIGSFLHPPNLKDATHFIPALTEVEKDLHSLPCQFNISNPTLYWVIFSFLHLNKLVLQWPPWYCNDLKSLYSLSSLSWPSNKIAALIFYFKIMQV